MKKVKKNKRANITFTEAEFNEIEKIADSKEWSFSKAGRYFLIKKYAEFEKKHSKKVNQ